ncbi:MAG: SRPBCC family protein [Actinobacteria bacterium]|nr:SRPBCC family protein [Actinomycetota bacterium]
MIVQSKYEKHYEEIAEVPAEPKSVFTFVDDHKNFSSHMSQSSWMMGGSKMETIIDEGKGQKAGSHIKMRGKIFGINLFLDEVITQHEAPYRKAWETVGKINLVVIDHYKLGFEIIPNNHSSKLKVYIDYNLPKSWKTRLLGVLFGEIYAKWCVRQMYQGVKNHFQS